MTRIDAIITDVIKREGPPTNDPDDTGGRTAFGISERANPSAWADGKVTEAEAREIYERKYVKYPKFDQVEDPHLQAQLVDFGVLSGSFVAIQELQKILHVSVDGILGPETLAALLKVHPEEINTALVVARLKMIGRIISRNPSQSKFALGWITRACEFLA